MKILHALVGYFNLAVTLNSLVTLAVLHFHPFAFASPLAAIDYDGYVNTTQNHGDSALMKRVPGDIVEARQAAVIVLAVAAILFLVATVILGIVWIEGDNLVRGNDVELLVEHLIRSLC
jgi:hypothetical protein